MPKSQITIKMNGSTNAIIIGGVAFDRSTMTSQQRRGLVDLVRDSLFAAPKESQAPLQRHNRGR